MMQWLANLFASPLANLRSKMPSKMRLKQRSRQSASNPKLSQRLSVTLALTLLVVLVIATLAAAITAYLEAREFQDETLLSVGYLVGSDQVSVQYNRRLFRDNDYDDGVRVWEIDAGNDKGHSDFYIDPSIRDGFHTLDSRRMKWRVLIVSNATSGQRYAVVQKQSVSLELAMNSAANTALPLLGLLLLFPLLIYLVVRHSFKPLRVLSERIGLAEVSRPQSLSNQSIPHEVKPFVAAIDTLLEKNHQYNERQRRFVADAAHELRTPITALSLEIENLAQSRDDATRQQRQMALGHSVERLQRLVAQLLDLARSQATEQVDPVQLRAVALGDLVRDQLSGLIVLAERKSIELTVTRNETVEILDLNDQLQHLIQNALSNAIKFTPDNGNIDIEWYAEDGQAVLQVLDDGPGVPETDLKRICEPFFRSADNATGLGAGLGLAICHEIARHLGGTLELSNRAKNTNNSSSEPSARGFSFKYSQPLA